MVYASFFDKKVSLFVFPISEMTAAGEGTRGAFTETVPPCLAVV